LRDLSGIIRILGIFRENIRIIIFFYPQPKDLMSGNAEVKADGIGFYTTRNNLYAFRSGQDNWGEQNVSLSISPKSSHFSSASNIQRSDAEVG
jgi:hypothetical protein